MRVLGKHTAFIISRLLIFLGKPLYYVLLGFVEILTKISVKKIHINFYRPTFNLWHLGIVLLSSVTIGGWLFFSEILVDLPAPQKLADRQIEASTKIYDRNGMLLYKIYKDKNRSLVNLEDVPFHVRLAVLAAEDADFYKHPGFSIKGITRSVIKFVKKGQVTSGSTITQQLVKNALLSPEKTISRKLRELILAIQVERQYSKDQILEMYLNEVPYGGTAYGISEAAKAFFGKEVADITLAESAFLAGLPKSPTRLSPFGSQSGLAYERQREILGLMLSHNFITQEQYDTAINEDIALVAQKQEIKAPHFVMYVKELLVEKYGEDIVATGGLEVYTTLDLSIQTIAEEAVKQELLKLEKTHVTNAGALVIHPNTGEILAMVGSKNYFDIANEGNVNVTTSLRQPGSSIKIVNYAYALSHGFTAASILDDSPITYSIKGQPPYSPKNYDNRFRGKIPLRSALAESRNIPAVKLLASYGVNQMVTMGQQMGIDNWKEPSRFGLSLTLGGGEVTLIDLARVYATVANYGQKPQIASISAIKNQKGKIIYQNNCIFPTSDKFKWSIASFAYAAESANQGCNKTSVLDPRVAFILIDILKDNAARSPAFGSRSALIVPNHPEVAVKTGTSNNLRDNLTVGFTKDYLTAVWVGNNDNSPMSAIASGVTGAAPIWNNIMQSILKDREVVNWQPPSGVISIPVCSFTGTLPCSGCPTKNEWFLEETKPTSACNKVHLTQNQ